MPKMAVLNPYPTPKNAINGRFLKILRQNKKLVLDIFQLFDIIIGMINIENNKTKDECLKELVDLMTTYIKNRGKANISKELTLSLIKYKLADLQLSNIKFSLLKGVDSCLGAHGEDIIILNDKLFKGGYKRVVKIIDSILHEFSHLETAKENAKIQKDEYGNPSATYLEHFKYENVLYAVRTICGFDLETSVDVTLSLYSTNRNEQKANNQAFIGSLELFYEVEKQCPSKMLEKMRAYLKKVYFKTKREISSKNYLLDAYGKIIEDSFKNFQMNFASFPKDNKVEVIKYEAAHSIHPNDEADQKLFNHLLKQGNLDACLKMINNPSFKNNPYNIINLIKLIKNKGGDLSCIKGVNSEALKRVIASMSTNASQPVNRHDNQLENKPLISNSNIEF